MRVIRRVGMKSNMMPVLVTVVLTLIIAVVFKTVLHRPLDVIPLYLAPIFFISVISGQIL